MATESKQIATVSSCELSTNGKYVMILGVGVGIRFQHQQRLSTNGHGQQTNSKGQFRRIEHLEQQRFEMAHTNFNVP
jgi:hypothetical protein